MYVCIYNYCLQQRHKMVAMAATLLSTAAFPVSVSGLSTKRTVVIRRTSAARASPALIAPSIRVPCQRIATCVMAIRAASTWESRGSTSTAPDVSTFTPTTSTSPTSATATQVRYIYDVFLTSER